MKMALFAVMGGAASLPYGLACLRSQTVSYIKTSMLYITNRTAPASALRESGPDRRWRGAAAPPGTCPGRPPFREKNDGRKTAEKPPRPPVYRRRQNPPHRTQN